MSGLAEKLAGRFIVIDGPDGAGKTTQLERLGEFLSGEGLGVQRAIDPGGTDTGREIRDILLHGRDMSLSPMCETLLFMASRAQLAAEVIRPAVEAGKVVLCDRFISATLAYQGALGVNRAMILQLGALAVDGLWPDLTIILDLPAEQGINRLGGDRDRMESRSTDYHRKVREIFIDLRADYPGAVAVVDAAGTVEEVAGRIRNLLTRHFLQSR